MAVLRTLQFLGFAFALLVNAPALAQNRTNDPQGYVEDLISDLISSDGHKVAVFGLSVSLTGNVQAERVTVSDFKGAWLEIDGFSLDWDPFSLLGDILTVNSFEITGLTVHRRPEQPPTESTAEMPAPKPVSIKRIQINRISLAEGVAGEAAELTADGSIDITADPVRIAVDTGVRRIDSVTGAFTAKIDYQPQTEMLSVDVRGTDGPSGLVGNLLNIPGRPKLDLTIVGDGPLDAWGARISLRSGTDQAVAGDVRLASVASGRRLGMALEGSVSAFLPAMLEPAFRGRAVLAGSVLFPAEKAPVIVETFFLETAAAKLDVSGAIDPAGELTRLQITATTPSAATELARMPDQSGPVFVAGLQANATLSGNLDNPRWTFAGQVQQIKAGPETIADLQITGANEAAANNASGFAANISARLESDRPAPWMASLRGPIRAAVSGTYGGEQPLVLKTAELSVAAGRLNVAGAYQPGGQIFDLEIDAELNNLKSGNDLVDRLLSDPARLSGKLAGTGPADPIRVAGLRLSTPAVSATLNGAVGVENLDLTAEGQLADLSRLSARTGGRIAFRAALSGPVRGPEVSLMASGTDVSLSGNALENAALEFTGVLDAQAPSGVFRLTGRYLDTPLNAGFSLRSEADGTRSLTDLDVRIAGTELSGALNLSPDNRPRGRLEFDAPDLSGLGAFLLLDLDGALEGSVDIQAAGPADQAVVRASGRAIRVQGVSVGALDANVTLPDINRPTQALGEIKASEVQRGIIAVDELTVNASRQADGYAMNLDASGKTISGTASVQLAPRDDGFLLTLNSADMTLFGAPISLQQPARILAMAERVQIEATRLAVGDGSLDVEGVYASTLDLQVHARAIPLALVGIVAPDAGLSGTVAGRATVSGSPQSPNVSFNATLSNASTGATRQAGLPPLDITTSGEMSGDTVTLQSTASGREDMQLTGAGRVVLSEPPTLDLTVGGRLPIALFADELARNGIRARGIVTPDLKITGPLTKPAFTGSVGVSDATIGDVQGRITVRSVSGQVQLNGDRIELTDLSGKMSDGTLSVSASTGFSPDSPISGKVTIRRGRYVDGTLVVATFDTDLDISGSRSSGILIGGEIVLLSTTITLDTLPPAARQLADIKHKQPPVPVARQWALLQDRRQRSGGSGAALDLTVRTAKPIQVRGRGIDADFGGRLQLSGTTDNIEPVGRFDLLRGTLTIVGRRLTFDRGTLNFTGNFNPEFDISATGTTADTSVTLTLSGTVEKPLVTIQSVPELPPEEALASLVFQQSTTDLSPIQVARLADAILVLNGGTRSGLFEGLRRTVGIDRLDVSSGADGSTSVSAGRYLNENTYLSVEQGVDEGTTKVTIDLDITRNIKLRTGAGTNGETEAGIVFEKEY